MRSTPKVSMEYVHGAKGIEPQDLIGYRVGEELLVGRFPAEPSHLIWPALGLLGEGFAECIVSFAVRTWQDLWINIARH